MAHYAFINNSNIVTEVIVGLDESYGDMDWELHYENFKKIKCKRTSYNTRGGVHYQPNTNTPSEDQSKALRKNYAGIGYAYDEARDAFIPPKHYKSWALNEETCLWDPPVPYPEDGKMYNWNESTLDWEEIIIDK